MLTIELAVLLAVILDIIFGDPVFKSPILYHPICHIGTLISKTEKFLRPKFKNQFTAGIFLVIIVCLCTFTIPFAILTLCYFIHPILCFVVNTFFCYQILASNSLKKAAMEVFEPLKNGDIANARKYVGYIVGRETDKLNEKGIIKATVETVAENTTDGVIAPIVFMLLGGAPLAFMYKGINTMDSMVGYKNDKYILFGRAAAKTDDFMNFIPARLSALLMIVSASICGFNGKKAWQIFKRDRKNHKSPNSAQTESVCAGALEVELAGNAVYFGKVVEKPTIGDNIREIEKNDIKKSVKLMYGTLFLTCFLILISYVLRVVL